MTRALVLLAIVATAIAAEVLLVPPVTTALGLQRWDDFILSFGGVMIGMYGLPAFGRAWSKWREDRRGGML